MDDVAALRALHEVERTAHLTGDADLLASVFADEVHEASRGRMSTLTRAAMRDRFRAYFATVRYLRWADVEPPLVRVAGSMAWMLVHVRASRAGSDGVTLPDFESSWIATYERAGRGWLMTAISSSVAEAP